MSRPNPQGGCAGVPRALRASAPSYMYRSRAYSSKLAERFKGMVIKDEFNQPTLQQIMTSWKLSCTPQCYRDDVVQTNEAIHGRIGEITEQLPPIAGCLSMLFLTDCFLGTYFERVAKKLSDLQRKGVEKTLWHFVNSTGRLSVVSGCMLCAHAYGPNALQKLGCVRESSARVLLSRTRRR